MQQVILRVPGSCGELLQGSIDDQNFLISCPINLYTEVKAHFIDSEKKIIINKNNSSTENTYKTEIAVKKLLNHYNFKQKAIKIRINSQLISGIGMASSTADISAAAAAVMLLLKNKVDFKLLKKICLDLEPTDSVFLEGIRFFDHLNGKKDYLLTAFPPEIDILIFKEKGTVDSLSFNQSKQLNLLNKDKEEKIKKSFKLIKSGFKENDYYLLGRGTTLSSLAHQKILYKKDLNKLLQIIQKNNKIYGINIAHSGTMIGVLAAKNLRTEKILNEIKEKTELEHLKRVKIISGGIERRVNNGTHAWRQIN
ncbi:threonine kinase [Halanaerobium congolense]|uniref:Threonine kinase n=1 Tax=Halanaerobium congolense TaxID=54121 RepID=A0A1M7J8E5_9FIRM|nr:GHMP kinase [Halanaerobium congolense]PTX15372.1 threonine kinase [Halanaerobium congolense]SDF86129.1 threonine kinase [Halanaerobium congolense]SDH78330.1 threonine kinase [Halanaerobium congolense]SET12082.1 threonine kinase [Halanaerobium congolense]SFP56847.1 threonine kinase [Halanaerobium congolense]